MPEFEIFVLKQRGSFTKENLLRFKSDNRTKLSEQVAGMFDALDAKAALQLNPVTVGGNDYLPLPSPRGTGNRWKESGGGNAHLDWPKVAEVITLLEGLQKIFDPALTGAFEVPVERAPQLDMSFQFATKKFVSDHVSHLVPKGSNISAEASKVAKRRMVVQGAFSAITTSSTIDLSTKTNREHLEDEIESRQAEFEAVYRYLVSTGKRQETLLQGDHEEVIYTSEYRFNFYECTQGSMNGNLAALPTTTKYAQNHLRYATQKVQDKWLLHHMAGRAAADAENTPPNAQYSLFNYAIHTPGITAVKGTFTKIG